MAQSSLASSRATNISPVPSRSARWDLLDAYLATNSGPLPERTCPGIPRKMRRSESTWSSNSSKPCRKIGDVLTATTSCQNWFSV
jgi:hypothetical protein